MTKTCSCCKIDKPLEAFNVKKSCKDGRRAQCKECRKQERIDTREERSKRWKERYQQIKDLPETRARQKASAERHKEARKEYRNRSRDKINETRRKHYQENRKIILLRMKAHREENLDHVNKRRRANRQRNLDTMRAKESIRQKERRARDLQYRMKGNLRTRINHAMENRSESSQDLLGCSMDHYIRHLTSQLKPDMTWENYGSYWEVDHVKPCATFDLTDPVQQKACFHWSNTQPLTKSDNCRKGTKIDFEPVYLESTQPI